MNIIDSVFTMQSHILYAKLHIIIIRTYTIPSINHYYAENIDLPQLIIK